MMAGCLARALRKQDKCLCILRPCGQNGLRPPVSPAGVWPESSHERCVRSTEYLLVVGMQLLPLMATLPSPMLRVLPISE